MCRLPPTRWVCVCVARGFFVTLPLPCHADGCHLDCAVGCVPIKFANGAVVERSDALACTTLQSSRLKFLNDRRCNRGSSPVPWLHYGCYPTGELGQSTAVCFRLTREGKGPPQARTSWREVLRAVKTGYLNTLLAVNRAKFGCRCRRSQPTPRAHRWPWRACDGHNKQQWDRSEHHDRGRRHKWRGLHRRRHGLRQLHARDRHGAATRRLRVIQLRVVGRHRLRLRCRCRIHQHVFSEQ